jgi:hypothetical protein
MPLWCAVVRSAAVMALGWSDTEHTA